MISNALPLDEHLEDLLFAMQQKNLVYNTDFLYYSNQVLHKEQMKITYNHPDGWVYADSDNNGSISYNVANECCRIIKNAEQKPMTFRQAIHEFPRWKRTLREKWVTASAVVSTPSGTSNKISLSLHDGINTSSRSVTLVPNEKCVIKVDLLVNDEADQLTVLLESSSPNATFDIYRVYANVGRVALSNLPLMVQGIIGERKQYISMETPPATELSLCQPSAPLTKGYSRLNSVLNGVFGATTKGESLLPDMRGYFSRSWNNGGTVDRDASTRSAWGQGIRIGDRVGTLEADAFRSHSHQLQFSIEGHILPGTAGTPLNSVIKTAKDSTLSTGGKETRGINIAELYTIKWA